MEALLSNSNVARSGFLERVFAVTVILCSTAAFGSLWMTEDQVANFKGGEVWLQVSWGTVFACATLLLRKHCPGSFRRVLREKWILALVGLAVCSALWSEVPMVTLRHGLAVAAGCIFSMYLVERFTPGEQLKILAWVFGLAALLSYIFEAFKLGAPVFEVAGAWIGIYSHKNLLGRTMALGTLVFSLLSERLRKGKWFAQAALVSCLILIILSQSMTAMMVVLLLLYAKHLIKVAIRRRGGIRWRIWAPILAASFSLPWLMSDLDRITELLDRDPTLTGRTLLWGALTSMAVERPLVGYGYGGFWLGDEGPSAVIWRVTPIPGAHNGLLDLLLDLGLVGVLIAVAGYVYYLRKAFHVFALERTWDSAWPILFLLALLLLNLTESNFMAANSFYWFVYVAVSIYVSRRMSVLTAHNGVEV